MRSEVDSSTKLIAKRALGAVRSVGPEGCAADQGVTEHFEVPPGPQSQARADADEHGPGTGSAEGSMHTQRLNVYSEPILVKPGDPTVDAVLVFRHVGQLIKSDEGIAHVSLPAIVFKHALYLLRLRSGRRRHGRRVSENR